MYKPKTALVTGAMGGLGTAICRALYNNDVDVIANCLPGYAGRAEWERDQLAFGYAFDIAEFDVTNYQQCQEVIAGLGAIDILVNNAGITRDKMFANMDIDQWNAVINTNLCSLFNVTQQVSNKMAARGYGRIINISSVNGIKGQAGQTNYSAAKAGVIGFTKALAQELASKGVTVNSIAPGYIATDMVLAIREDVVKSITDSIPMKRLGTPEEVGKLCAYLASKDASYITGTTVNINGGLHM